MYPWGGGQWAVDNEMSMILTKNQFLVYSQNDPNNPLINNLRSESFIIQAFQSCPKAKSESHLITIVASRFGLFNPEVRGCSPGGSFDPIGQRQFLQLHEQALMKNCPHVPHSELSSQ
jgi:hypothetical protein